ncbi:MAG: hypothetical protein PVH61_34095 [Candidatus Aminicenantes bacterium]|jgi:hypothetical protein
MLNDTQTQLNYRQKIKMIRPYQCQYGYAGGWSWIMSSLRCLHRDDGVLFDDFIENSFNWQRDESLKENIIPYKMPWIGFVHCPYNIPESFAEYRSPPQGIFENIEWEKSLPYCRGLFCLSDSHRNWLETRFHIPIVKLIHPTKRPGEPFSLEKFDANKEKKIVQVGVYLRRFFSIYQLPVKRLKKKFLKVNGNWVDELIEAEKKRLNVKVDADSTEVISYLPDYEYDKLLSKNIVFLHLYDSIANNTIVECIARNTPILVNPLESVREYLGESYPYYFETLEEAAWKAENIQLIYETYNYLQDLPIKDKLTSEYFCESFVQSDIYQKL